MAKQTRYHLFETAAGFVALGWNASGVSALRLPATNVDEAERAALLADQEFARQYFASLLAAANAD